MLSIRLQRTGRKNLAQFRLVVQESHRTPTSGKVVANLGHYNPHTKASQIDLKKLKFYLKNGAQPTHRVQVLLLSQKVQLPNWVKTPPASQRQTKNPDKLRRHQVAPVATPTKTKQSDPKDSQTPTSNDKPASKTNDDDSPSRQEVPATDKDK